MANRTVKDAVTVKGTNPQYLVEKIIRSRIYDSRYWKEECFALTAELLVDKAMKLKYVGGIFGSNIKPTPFLCLVLKMLQIQPEKDIIIEFIKNEDYKYVRALGAYYLRLTGTSLDCYNYVEPLLNDYRKLRVQNRQGGYELSFMDEFVDRLLREERMCDVILPRIQRRQVHEESGDMEPRVSALEDDLEELAEDSGDDDPPIATPPRSAPPAVEATSRHSRREHGSSNHHSSREHHHHRRSPERQREHKRRSRSRSRERDRRDRHRPEKRHRDKERDHHHRHKERKKHRESGTDDRREINEANALRAKLGLPPLRP